MGSTAAQLERIRPTSVGVIGGVPFVRPCAPPGRSGPGSIASIGRAYDGHPSVHGHDIRRTRRWRNVHNGDVPIVAVLAAVVAALVHVWFFALESLLFERPTVFARFGLRSAEQAAIVRPMAFNQGFYNLFLAAGIVVGLVLVGAGQMAAGRAVVLFACACMVGAGIVLVATNRRFLTAAAIQAGPPTLGRARHARPVGRASRGLRGSSAYGARRTFVRWSMAARGR